KNRTTIPSSPVRGTRPIAVCSVATVNPLTVDARVVLRALRRRTGGVRGQKPLLTLIKQPFLLLRCRREGSNVFAHQCIARNTHRSLCTFLLRRRKLCFVVLVLH